MVALEDLERTARLLATLVRRVEDGMDFIGSAARRLGGCEDREACHCETRWRGKAMALPLLRARSMGDAASADTPNLSLSQP